MLVESAIRNICQSGDAPDANEIDWLDLTWLECRIRFARKRTRGNREIRLLLRLQQTLKHGDVLGTWPDGLTAVVNLLPADVLVVRPGDSLEALTAAFQIGNLHVPIEVTPDALFVAHSSEVEATLSKYNLPYAPQKRRFSPTHWPDSVQLSRNFRIIRRRDQPSEKL